QVTRSGKHRRKTSAAPRTAARPPFGRTSRKTHSSPPSSDPRDYESSPQRSRQTSVDPWEGRWPQLRLESFGVAYRSRELGQQSRLAEGKSQKSPTHHRGRPKIRMGALAGPYELPPQRRNPATEVAPVSLQWEIQGSRRPRSSSYDSSQSPL